MRKLQTIAAVASAIAAPLGVAYADGPYKQSQTEVYVQPGRAIEVDASVRYWNSIGTMSKDLFAPGNRAQQVSRLTYRDTQAHSAELALRGDHKSTGLFVKGFVGGGSITNGKMNDEDWLPARFGGYSNTLQETHNGNLTYFTIDLGWTFYDSMKIKHAASIKDDDHGSGINARLGGFVGYNYWNEFARTYGCSQQAGAPICNPSPVSTGTYSLGQDNTWRSWRLGMTGEVALGHRWTLSGEAAYTITDLSGLDHHKLRPDIDPLKETGDGNGIQLEGLLKYNVTETFGIGVGARYWKNYTNGSVTFPGAPLASPERWEAERAGVFVQGSMKFN